MSVQVVRIPPGLFALAVLAFTVLPLLELGLLFVLSGSVGIIPTLLLCASTGFAGAWLARWQGTKTLLAARESLSTGRFPGSQILDGALLLVGGVVLLTPGLITDCLGFLVLVPFTREIIKTQLRRYWKRQSSGVSDDVIDVSFEEEP